MGESVLEMDDEWRNGKLATHRFGGLEGVKERHIGSGISVVGKAKREVETGDGRAEAQQQEEYDGSGRRCLSGRRSTHVQAEKVASR